MRWKLNGKLRKTAMLAGLSAAALLLAGCTSAADVNASGGSATNEAAKKIAFDYPFTSLAIYATLTDSMTERANELGYEIVTTDDQASLDKQISNLNGLVSSDVSAVISFPMEPAAVQSIMTRMQSNGIKWITYGAHIEGEDGSIDWAGETSARTQVEAFVDWAAKNNVKSGPVLITVFEGDDLGRSRTAGLRDTMAELAPQFTVYEQSAVNTEQGLAAGRAELSKHADLVGAIGLNDGVALGLAQAAKEGGIQPNDKFYVGGIDGTPEVIEAINSGESVIRTTVGADMNEVGRAMVDVAVGLVEGGADGAYVVKHQLITAGN